MSHVWNGNIPLCSLGGKKSQTAKRQKHSHTQARAHLEPLSHTACGGFQMIGVSQASSLLGGINILAWNPRWHHWHLAKFFGQPTLRIPSHQGDSGKRLNCALKCQVTLDQKQQGIWVQALNRFARIEAKTKSVAKQLKVLSAFTLGNPLKQIPPTVYILCKNKSL